MSSVAATPTPLEARTQTPPPTTDQLSLLLLSADGVQEGLVSVCRGRGGTALFPAILQPCSCPANQLSPRTATSSSVVIGWGAAGAGGKGEGGTLPSHRVDELTDFKHLQHPLPPTPNSSGVSSLWYTAIHFMTNRKGLRNGQKKKKNNNTMLTCPGMFYVLTCLKVSAIAVVKL